MNPMREGVWGALFDEGVVLLPLAAFLLFMLWVSYAVRQRREAGVSFIQQYFIGGRDLGGFVLAMTTVATYSSISSFVGGPGQAWVLGFGWLYMAIVQVTAVFLVMGVLGKKVALISRRINAVTVVDIIRARYGSDLLANLSAGVVVLFFCAMMVAQFVGGAKLFETVTGYSYTFGLVLFGVIVVLYTTVGGFRGVAFTDTFCAFMMIGGMALLLWAVLEAGGGYATIMETIRARHPEMLEPLAGGGMSYGFYLTQWILVGLATIALPQSVVRGISYKDTRALHRAMLIGTIVIGFMILITHFIGVFAKGVLTQEIGAYGGNVDYIIPRLITATLPPWLVGVTIVGPIAATMSTVSSLLIVCSSAIVKDVYLYEKAKRGERVSERRVRGISMLTTVVFGLAVFVVSIVPPDVIWIINMFAFGGLETAFLWTILLGLFWKRANKTGAIAAMVGSTAAYCLSMALGFKVFGLHQIVIGLAVSGVLFVLGSFWGKRSDASALRVFFPFD